MVYEVVATSQVGIDINGTLKLPISVNFSQAGRNESSDISTESRIQMLRYRELSYLDVSLKHKSMILKIADAFRKIRSRDVKISHVEWTHTHLAQKVVMYMFFFVSEHEYYRK